MTDHDALYRAIIAHPADDTPRLVYADWLQEHDRAEEAEFIRLGCWLESNAPDHPDYPEWMLRQEELQLWLATHVSGPTPKFSAGLSVDGGPRWWTSTRRGFPRFLEFEGTNRSGLKPIRQLAAALEKAFTRIPTRWLVVRFITVAQLAELLKQPVMEQVDTLTVQLHQTSEPDDEPAVLIANSPRLRNLRGASLWFPIRSDGIAALARSENLDRLEWLSLPGERLVASQVRTLGTAPWFRNLRALKLEKDIPETGFLELCGLAPFPRLHTLELLGSSFSAPGWRTFAQAKAFPALARLELAQTYLGAGGLEAFSEAKELRLAYLGLANCAIGNSGATALANVPWLGGLRWLDLSANLLTPHGVAPIAGSRKLTELKWLSLRKNVLGGSGLWVVASNPALRGLLALDVGGDLHHLENLTPAHFEEFLTLLDMPQLRHLSLRGRPVGAKVAKLLAHDKFASLTRLDLGNCRLTPSAPGSLLTSPALQNLVELNLDQNKLKHGLEPLANPRTLPRLGLCQVNANGMSALLKAKLARRRGVEV